jgi:preprotein translocase subunit SecG
MLTLLIGFLTVALVLNCILLVLLILIQLPKKEAGIGMAFGSGATETLFGAGSGTVLTKVTKYGVGVFLTLSLVLAMLGTHQVRKGRSSLDAELQRRVGAPAAVAPAVTSSPPAATLSSTPATAPGSSNAPVLQLSSTNAPATPPTPPQ